MESQTTRRRAELMWVRVQQRCPWCSKTDNTLDDQQRGLGCALRRTLLLGLTLMGQCYEPFFRIKTNFAGQSFRF